MAKDILKTHDAAVNASRMASMMVHNNGQSKLSQDDQRKFLDQKTMEMMAIAEQGNRLLDKAGMH